jgi:hypothetical protein
MNGYYWEYKKNLQSHAAYAVRHGYRYVVIDRPQISLLGMECVWLKVALMREALKAGYDWVMFVDADAEIQTSAPAIESLQEEGKSIYLAKGYSGRVNSGVLIASQAKASLEFFERVLSGHGSELPPEDDVGWGENGHIIHFAKNNPSVKTISTRWNNNRDPYLRDFIRHYSAGPLRSSYRPGFVNHLFFLAHRYFVALARRLSRVSGTKSPSFMSRLNSLVEAARTQSDAFLYPEIRRP